MQTVERSAPFNIRHIQASLEDFVRKGMLFISIMMVRADTLLWSVIRGFRSGHFLISAVDECLDGD
ncbi:hypothetical protein NKH23_28555 [Mesorhizobium sp. M1328]|uniref:hypothetical protein n=1 Tax=Mesorhizobium sp. M1328 TaxID=2957082 RepID=UPI003337DEAB